MRQPQVGAGADAPLPCSLCFPVPPGLHPRLHGDPPGGEREPGPHRSRASAAARGLQGEQTPMFSSERLWGPKRQETPLPASQVSGRQGVVRRLEAPSPPMGFSCAEAVGCRRPS